jgi:hypothetical protein
MLKRGSTILSKKLYKLTIGGGLTFWVTTIAISLTPIRAEFRAALSMSYIQTVLIEALLGSLIIGFFVSYFLVRFFYKIPTKEPILKSVILTFIPYVINLILLGVAASRTSDASHVFLVGAALNVPTYLALGIVIGYLYKRMYGSHQLRQADGLK